MSIGAKTIDGRSNRRRPHSSYGNGTRVMTNRDIAAMLADHAALAGTEDSSKARLVGQSMARCGAELRARGRKTLVLTQGPVRLHLGHGRT